MRDKARGLLEIHGAVLLFGLSGLFGKFLPLSPFIIVLGRTFFAFVTLGLVLLCSKQSLAIRSKKDFGAFFLLGAILAVHWTTFFHSIQISTVAVGLLSFSTFPVFVTFMEPFFFNEKLQIFDIMTAIVVFCGLILVIPYFDFGNTITLGVFWGTVSGLAFAVLQLLNRKYVKVYSSPVIVFYQSVFATFILSPSLSLRSQGLDSRAILLLVLLGVFCTALAHGLFINGLRHVRAQLASICASLEPVYGVLFALFFQHPWILSDWVQTV